MRSTNNNKSVPIRYENTNISEGYTKLSNLILFYPFNPQKERSQNMHWLHYDNMPFCGVIGECNRKGYPLFSDWFETSREHRPRIDNTTIRKKVIKRFTELLEKIEYTKKKEYIRVNNYFKELDCWIGEIYKKISYMDNKGGWKETALNEIVGTEEWLRKAKSENNYPAYRRSGEIENAFRKVFNFRIITFYEDSVKNILSSLEFDDLINEIFRLIGKDWVSCDGGKLRILGNSVEEFEEKKVYKYLDKYPKVLENLNKAYEHKLNGQWNDVSLYCCKALENFYKNLLGNKKKYEKLGLENLIQQIRNNKKQLFKKTDSAVMGGIDNLLLSGINTVGTIRNTRDSGHGNVRDVLDWEAKMGYSYSILLLRTLLKIRK